MIRRREQGPPQPVFRGAILSATIAKHVSYFISADNRGQGLIALNAVLIPVAFSGLRYAGELRAAALVCILTALVTICFAIFALYPKRFGPKDKSFINVLHYSHFGRISEAEYIKRMAVLYEDNDKLAEVAARDLYHFGTRILGPKIMLLQGAYLAFLFGNLIAVMLAVRAAHL